MKQAINSNGQLFRLLHPWLFLPCLSKWRAANVSERPACQQHFWTCTSWPGQPTPAAADPEGAWYCFERGVSKSDGGQGWAALHSCVNSAAPVKQRVREFASESLGCEQYP